MILRLQAGDNAAVQQIVSTSSPSAEAVAGASLLRWYIMSFPERTVVTGAGVAGFRVVEELRRRGYSGQLTLIGAEDRPPYDRPPLSKRVLTDGIDPSLNADFASLDVDFHPGETAVALEAPAPVAAAPVPATLPSGPAREPALITNRDK